MKTMLAAVLSLALLLPSMADAGVIWVDGYCRKSGKCVQGHWRTTPDGRLDNNLSYRGGARSLGLPSVQAPAYVVPQPQPAPAQPSKRYEPFEHCTTIPQRFPDWRTRPRLAAVMERCAAAAAAHR